MVKELPDSESLSWTSSSTRSQKNVGHRGAWQRLWIAWTVKVEQEHVTEQSMLGTSLKLVGRVTRTSFLRVAYRGPGSKRVLMKETLGVTFCLLKISSFWLFLATGPQLCCCFYSTLHYQEFLPWKKEQAESPGCGQSFEYHWALFVEARPRDQDKAFIRLLSMSLFPV